MRKVAEEAAAEETRIAEAAIEAARAAARAAEAEAKKRKEEEEEAHSLGPHQIPDDIIVLKERQG